MAKKWTAVILTTVIIALSCIPIGAESGQSITIEQAESYMLENNRTLKELKMSRQKALLSYTNSVRRAEDINPKGYSYTINDNIIEGFYGDHIAVNLTKQKELVPLQMKYNWETISSNYTLTKRQLLIDLRNTYSNLINAEISLKKLEANKDLALETYERAKSKYIQGLISEIEMEEMEYNNFNLMKQIDSAKRLKENYCRNLNLLIGTDIDIVYDMILFKEEYKGLQLKNVDYYISKALKERFEIVNIEKQIDLTQREIGILESFPQLIKNDKYTIEQYNNLIDKQSQLNLELEHIKNNIEQEIKKAYLDIKQSYSRLQNMRKSISIQKRKLEKLKKQYELGFVTGDALKAAESSINDLETQYDIEVFNFNTKLMKFNYAAGLGPAY